MIEVLACLLHDIGKFYQRTGVWLNINKYKHFLVNQNGRLSYYHAAYTAFFIEKCIKKEFQEFLYLSSSHHLPGLNNLKKADRLSAAHDRRDSDYDTMFGESNNITLDFITTRMYSIFNEIKLSKNSNKPMLVPLVSLEDFKEIKPFIRIHTNEAKDEYLDLFTEMTNRLIKIDYNSYYELYQMIYSILKNYTFAIPANTYNTKLPTVSLFDHQKLTTAIANCYQQSKRFVIIKYHLQGISDFVYQVDNLQEVRSRSFYIQILCEFLVHAILNEFNLYYENILYSLGGQGRILVPMTDDYLKKLKNITKKITKEVNCKHQGIIKFVLSYDIYEEKDLQLGRFRKKIKKNEKYIIKYRSEYKLTKNNFDINSISKIFCNNKFIIEYKFVKKTHNICSIDFNDLGSINFDPQSISDKTYYQSYNHDCWGDTKYFVNHWDYDFKGKSVLIIMDIFKLRTIFKKGIADNAQSISKFLTLSRFLELFFVRRVKDICQKIKNISVIYSGGDDLVCITDINNVKPTIVHMTHEFSNYTGNNEAFKLRFGIANYDCELISEVYKKAKQNLK